MEEHCHLRALPPSRKQKSSDKILINEPWRAVHITVKMNNHKLHLL